MNLLNNAAKYTPTGGRIWLTIEPEPGQAVVRVRDNGSGMTSELVLLVFDLFTQGARTLDRAQGGQGLGLTLVKRLVEMHGGSAEAFSAGPGSGSEFVIRLPAESIAEVAQAAAQPVHHSDTFAHISALVVDDVPDIADSYLWLLSDFVQGQQAIEQSCQRLPDVVICDIGMPGMDGLETVRRLRQIPGMDRAVIAAVSGYGGEDAARASRDAGFDKHLVKPVSMAMLLEVLAAVGERQR